MTKGEFIDLVLIRVNGGILNDEMPFERSDVETYSPAAVNYVITTEYRNTIKEEGNRELTGLFFGYFSDVAVGVDDNTNNRRYFQLPKAVVPLPSNQGIRSVIDGCEGMFFPIPESSVGNIEYYCKMFPSTRYYRLLGNRVYLYNVSALVKSLNVILLVDASALEYGDNLPLPAGLEAQAIDLAVQFILGLRQVPADVKNDKKPINA